MIVRAIPGKIQKVNAFLSSDGFRIFCGFFLLYILTMKTSLVNDATPNNLLPLLLLKYRTLNMGVVVNPHSYLFYPHNGAYYSIFSPGTSLLALPIYLPALFFRPSNLVLGLLAKTSASAISALAIVFIYLTSKKLSNRRIALITAIVFGVGTNVFAMSSQILMSFTGAILALSVGLYFLASGGGRKNLILAGLAFSYAGLCQPSLFLVLLLFGIFVLRRKWKDLPYYALGAAPPAILFAVYNWISYGSPFKIGEFLSSVYLISGKWDAKLPFSRLWNTPILKGLAGNLFSPSKGLFVFSPILIFAAIGLVITIKRRGEALYYYSGVASLIIILVASKWFDWSGSNGYGYRTTLAALPFLIIMSVPAFDRLKASKVLVVVFAFLLACSVFIQVVGYLAYDGGSWEWSVKSEGKYWSLTRNQIAWETAHLHFYVPEFWRNVIPGSVKASITGYKVKNKSDAAEVTFDVNMSQIGQVRLSLKRGDQIIASKIVSLPRGASKITLPPVSMTGDRTTLIVRTRDEVGTESDIYSKPFVNL